MTHAIETDRLGRFPPGTGPEHVLSDVSFVVPEGSCVGLVGGNGAGKSTLLRMLMGLAPIGNGMALIHGIRVPAPASRSQVAYLPEHAAPLDYVTGREHLRLFGELAGLSGRSLESAVVRALGEAGLTVAADVLARRYSKGMIQRLELARIFLAPRRLLVLDEPVTALDAASELALVDRLQALRAGGVTMVITSHALSILEKMCDRFVILNQGRVARMGTRDEILSSRGWALELIEDSPLPDPLPDGALPLGQRRGMLFADRSKAECALAALAPTGRVARFGTILKGIDDVLREIIAGTTQEGWRDG